MKRNIIILIITVVFIAILLPIILDVIFLTGSVKSPSTTTCRAPSGFICKSSLYNSATHVLSVVVGQGWSNNWTATTFTLEGTGIAAPITAGMGSATSITLDSGQLVTINFTIPTTDSAPGTIYAHYTNENNSNGVEIAMATWISQEFCIFSISTI